MRNIKVAIAVITIIPGLAGLILKYYYDKQPPNVTPIYQNTIIANIIPAIGNPTILPPKRVAPDPQLTEGLPLVGPQTRSINKERRLVVGQEWWEEKIGFYVRLDSIDNEQFYSDMSKRPIKYCAHLHIQTPESRLFPLEVCEKYESAFDSNDINYKVKILHNPTSFEDVHVRVSALGIHGS